MRLTRVYFPGELATGGEIALPEAAATHVARVLRLRAGDPLTVFDGRGNSCRAEIATLAGPQLVVPVDNARYALNAANARWGSLYDALYGTNVIPEDGGAEKGRGYNPVRGERVIAKANEFLDASVPLAGGKWADVVDIDVTGTRLACRVRDGRTTTG